MEKNTFDKIQPLFMIKSSKLSKLGIKGNFLNLTKGIYKIPATNIMDNSAFISKN